MTGYKRVSGTDYPADMSDELIRTLENARKRGHAVRVFMGDTDTGECWLEEYEVIGVFGRSGGKLKVPLLVPPGERGGSPISSVVKVMSVSNRRVLYEHPNFHMPLITFREIQAGDPYYDMGYRWAADVSGVNHANFKSKAERDNWFDFVWGRTMVSPEEFALEEVVGRARDALAGLASELGVEVDYIVGLMAKDGGGDADDNG